MPGLDGVMVATATAQVWQGVGTTGPQGLIVVHLIGESRDPEGATVHAQAIITPQYFLANDHPHAATRALHDGSAGHAAARHGLQPGR